MKKIPVDFMGYITAQLEVVPPAPVCLHRSVGSIWVRCRWRTGILWWRTHHDVTQEFIYRSGDLFWPGCTKVSSATWRQIYDALLEYHAKREALSIAGLEA